MTSDPITQDPRPDDLRRATSLVVLHTGNGKGKTTAAIGVAVRAVGQGWKVAVLQFVKSGEWATGEEKSCKLLGVDFRTLGDGFTWDSENLENDKAAAGRAWSEAKKVIEDGAHQLVVLDEITYLCSWNWIDTNEVVETIQNRPTHVNVVLTGRDALPELIALADTASETQSIHHAYDKKIAALRGIDF